MYVCLCKGVTDSQIEQAVRNGCRSVRELKKNLAVGSQCGRCTSHARDVLHESIHAHCRPIEIRPSDSLDIEVCYT
ncbi:MAG: bacterioferritin-associated ferredoxin [Idiomarina sp.]|nr:bacterioferritin-associated ferredoxin [Idiomarina sp.]